MVAMNFFWKQLLRGAPWNQLKSENTETLHLLTALKEIIRKHALLWSKHECQ